MSKVNYNRLTTIDIMEKMAGRKPPKKPSFFTKMSAPFRKLRPVEAKSPEQTVTIIIGTLNLFLILINCGRFNI